MSPILVSLFSRRFGVVFTR